MPHIASTSSCDGCTTATTSANHHSGPLGDGDIIATTGPSADAASSSATSTRVSWRERGLCPAVLFRNNAPITSPDTPPDSLSRSSSQPEYSVSTSTDKIISRRTRRLHSGGIRNVSASASPTPPIDGPAAASPTSESSHDQCTSRPISTSPSPRNEPTTWDERKIAAVLSPPNDRSASGPKTSSSTVVAT